MADIDDALTWNTAQGNDAWIKLGPIVQAQMLAKSAAYMSVRYRVRPNLTDAQTILVANARYWIALDIAVNGPPATRYAGQIVKTSSELAGLKDSTEYANDGGQVDPYPMITSVLYPVLIRNTVANFASGSLIPVTQPVDDGFTYGVDPAYDPLAGSGF